MAVAHPKFTGLFPFLPTGPPSYRHHDGGSAAARAASEDVETVARYEITLKDRTVEVIDQADAYQQEGPMTTFFAMGDDRRVVDCWSTRLASFRTAEIVIIRRGSEPALGQGTYAPNQVMAVLGGGVAAMSAMAWLGAYVP